MTTHSESPSKHHPDHWTSTSDNHHHVERAVHPAIVELVKWATETVPPDASSKFFDDACGIGTVTIEVKKHFPDAPVLAIDSAAGMLKVLNHRAEHHKFKNVTTKLLDAADLKDIPSDSITHAFACTFIDLAHYPAACLRELYRILAPSGILAITTWVDPHHPSIGNPWTKACQRFKPDYKGPMVTNPRWSSPDQIKEHLEKVGFKGVETKKIETHWRWQNAEEMVNNFFDGGNPIKRRWVESWVEDHKGEEKAVRKAFVEEVDKYYERQGQWLVKAEGVNLSIARK